MSTTHRLGPVLVRPSLSPIRITTIPRIEDSEEAMKEMRSGMANAVAEAETPEVHAALRETDRVGPVEEHPGVLAFEAMVDEVIAEIAPEVAQMLEAAIAKRLPWTWEPER